MLRVSPLADENRAQNGGGLFWFRGIFAKLLSWGQTEGGWMLQLGAIVIVMSTGYRAVTKLEVPLLCCSRTKCTTVNGKPESLSVGLKRRCSCTIIESFARRCSRMLVMSKSARKVQGALQALSGHLARLNPGTWCAC